MSIVPRAPGLTEQLRGLQLQASVVWCSCQQRKAMFSTHCTCMAHPVRRQQYRTSALTDTAAKTDKLFCFSSRAYQDHAWADQIPPHVLSAI